jgi:C-terminal processing protease CtpA/Prc
VNEYTQSLGEMTAIALSNAPRAVVIGSTTSGADGNATRFILPGGMSVSYTVIGAYYPDWVQCQRTGVKIDIYARPTVQDILDRKDVLMERAIQYINEL